MKRVNQYLAQYAEPETAIAASLSGTWAHGLVVPACDEGSSVLDLLRDVERTDKRGRVLVVVVINGRSDAESRLHEQNETCAQAIRDRYNSADPALLRGEQIDVLIVDRFRPGRRLGPKEGVGTARKIGCDLLIELHRNGQFTGQWIASTDADARLPKSYFETLNTLDGCAAATYPFEHQPEAGYEDALALYELSLHHYVLGLEWARSPYAFHTIGSTIAVTIEAYVSSRGFPKRQAGEDFYLLNKVAKLGPVYRIGGPPVILLGRPSTRVPFGTGPAILRIQNSSAFTMYNPLVFHDLRDVLTAFAEGRAVPHRASLKGLYKLETHLQNKTPAHQQRKHIHDWFDGFRTLKFIHDRRDHTHPNLPWRDALNAAPWWRGSVPLQPTEALSVLRAEVYPDICGSTPTALNS